MIYRLIPRLAACLAAGWALCGAGAARASNITVTNVALIGQVEDSHWTVRFDVQWENSWRKDAVAPYNYDAAWIFLKWRTVGGGTSAWYHGTLSTNAADHVAPTGSTLAVGLSGGRGAWGTNGLGVFLYRATNGAGTFANNIHLRWNYAADGAGGGAHVEMKVCALEMVYVTGGAFYAGNTNSSESGHFCDGAGTGMPFLVQTEDQLAVSNQPNCLWGTVTGAADNTIGPEGVLSNAYPKGYAAFYCMKYKISGRQYADFLNTLTTTQAVTRCPNLALVNRYGITNIGGVYTSTLPYVACNNLSWADASAYADWAGLRPMTELEYEKACRGSNAPVAGEFAWGSTALTQATAINNSGQSNEAPQSGANCACDNKAGVQGPLRVGCFGVGSGMRVETGAGYYGMMEMSGNLWERVVTVGKAEGRAFTGLHGSGALTAAGEADVSGWPAAGTALGAGIRGGNWQNTNANARVADRVYGANGASSRDVYLGFRAVRSAP